jgi:hypothetical protein
MTRRPATNVTCSYCSTILAGTLTAGRQESYRIKAHKRPDGSNCVGHLSTNHWPAGAR